jgi:hypothetical protein
MVYLLIKYMDFFDEFSNKIERIYVLNSKYSKIFKSNPIYQFKSEFNDIKGNSTDIVLKKYFMKEISKKTYNIIRELNLVNNELDLINLLKI